MKIKSIIAKLMGVGSVSVQQLKSAGAVIGDNVAIYTKK